MFGYAVQADQNDMNEDQEERDTWQDCGVEDKKAVQCGFTDSFSPQHEAREK